MDVSEAGGVLSDNLPVKTYENLDGISTYSNLPDKLNLSTSKYFPPIRNQKGDSCAAWAQVYYQFTYEAARLNDWDAKHDYSKVFSPKYVWNYLNKGTDSGLYMYECYDFLKTQGAVRWTEFPQNELSFEWYAGANEAETVTVLQKALKTRISSYDYRNLADPEKNPTPITGNKDLKLEHMKQLLNEGHVLSVSTHCKVNGTENNRVLSNGQRGVVAGEINRMSSGKIIGHALTIVGYDDTIYYDLNQNGFIEEYEKGAFLIANSWGTDADEHNDGYIWVLYDALNQKSNASNMNSNNRNFFFEDYRYWYIEVKKYAPKRMVEVTLEQKYRDEISVFLYIAGGLDLNKENPRGTFLNNIGDTKSFDGGNNGYQMRTFVFDYDAFSDFNDDVENEICGIRIHDFNAGDGANTIVKKIRWIDGNGARFKVTFVENNNGLSTIWKIEASIPATTSGGDTVAFDFSKGTVKDVKSPELLRLIAYDSAIKTGVDTRAEDSLKQLLAAMQQSGTTLTVRNEDNTLVNVTSTTRAATGMKIIETDKNGWIAKIHYLVVFGDVTGGGITNMGDGEIDSKDQLIILKNNLELSQLGSLAQIAADADHDGSISAKDALLVNKHALRTGEINQNYTFTTVPDDCYYLDPVTF